MSKVLFALDAASESLSHYTLTHPGYIMFTLWLYGGWESPQAQGKTNLSSS